ncbi:MAG: hypothetical protein H0X29_05280 [Parachlamydiaceae bacterium]|nr:hypothetical protein [Parachlamydiaceae bacterium]
MTFSAELKSVGRNALVASLMGATLEFTKNNEMKDLGQLRLSKIAAEIAETGLAKMTFAMSAGAFMAVPLLIGTDNEKTEKAIAFFSGYLGLAALVMAKKSFLSTNVFVPGEVFAAFVSGAVIGGFLQRKFKVLKI